MASKPYSISDGWRDHFAPVARQVGFKGSGSDLRRIEGEFVQVINMQRSDDGRQFAVNLALHPLAMPDLSGHPVDPKSIKEYRCILRRRLSDDSDKWWDYTEERSSIEAAARDAAQLLLAKGLSWFDELSGPDSPILRAKAADFASCKYPFGEFTPVASLVKFGTSKPLTALSLGRFRKLQGNFAKASVFAKIGLERSTGSFVHQEELESLARQGA